MRRCVIALTLLFGLAACGDPLGDIPRVSEGAVVPDDTSAAVRPDAAELTREGGFLGGLFQRAEPAPLDPFAADTAAVDVADVTPTPDDAADAIPVVDGAVAADTAAAPVDVAADAAPADSETAPTELAETDAGGAAVADTDTPTVAAAPATGGVFGWLRRAADRETAPADVPAEAPVVLASAQVDAAPTPPRPDPVATDPVAPDATADVAAAPADLVEPAKRRGIFGLARARPASAATGLDARDVPPGTALAFGEIARVCAAKGKPLGKLIDRAARKGVGYRLYDSAPDSAGPRAFFITGFSDNCPRQITAALALFGAPELHEQLRYGLPAKEYPYSSTDEAYEKVKSAVCNVRRNKPCGGRLDRLEKTTVFVSMYENFSDNARWADLLLHDGAVLASAVKAP